MRRPGFLTRRLVVVVAAVATPTPFDVGPDSTPVGLPVRMADVLDHIVNEMPQGGHEGRRGFYIGLSGRAREIRGRFSLFVAPGFMVDLMEFGCWLWGARGIWVRSGRRDGGGCCVCNSFRGVREMQCNGDKESRERVDAC